MTFRLFSYLQGYNQCIDAFIEESQRVRIVITLYFCPRNHLYHLYIMYSSKANISYHYSHRNIYD